MTEPRRGWRFGVRRTGAVVEVRDRWQGLFGPNAWLNILLVFLGAVSGSRWVAALCVVACGFVVLRFHPFVRFGPDTVRWRNWFRCKEVPAASVTTLSISNYNGRSWVPVVTAALDGTQRWRRSARFIATFSFRRRAAVELASAVQSWADHHAIESDLDPRVMVWGITDPRKNPNLAWQRSRAAQVGLLAAFLLGALWLRRLSVVISAIAIVALAVGAVVFVVHRFVAADKP